MLELLDTLLHDTLKAGVKSLGLSPLDEQLSSSPPNEKWRQQHTNPSRPALSVYLVELRENLRLRSNERVERQPPAARGLHRAPYRLDCHYLISAFVFAEPDSDPPTTQREHTMLYQATAALTAARPLIPSRHYSPGSPKLTAWPEAFRDHEMFMDINPAAGFSKLSEFWASLSGTDHPWRPVVHVVITVPVELVDIALAPIVTRRTTAYQQGSARESFTEIGGVVLDAKKRTVPGASIVLTDINDGEVARTTAGEDGKYTLRLEPPGEVLYAAAFSLGRTPPINVQQVDDYTLQFA